LDDSDVEDEYSNKRSKPNKENDFDSAEEQKEIFSSIKCSEKSAEMKEKSNELNQNLVTLLCGKQTTEENEIFIKQENLCAWTSLHPTDDQNSSNQSLLLTETKKDLCSHSTKQDESQWFWAQAQRESKLQRKRDKEREEKENMIAKAKHLSHEEELEMTRAANEKLSQEKEMELMNQKHLEEQKRKEQEYAREIRREQERKQREQLTKTVNLDDVDVLRAMRQFPFFQDIA